MDTIKDQFINGKHVIELLRENNLSKAMLLKILKITTEDYKFVSSTKNRLEVIKAYESGMFIRDICVKFGIKDIIAQHCINRKKYLLTTPYMIDYYEKGEGVNDILSKYAISSTFFYDCIKELGMYKRNGSGQGLPRKLVGSRYNKQDLENYVKQGMTLSEIAKIYGVSRQAIQQVLKKYGLSTINWQFYDNFYKENNEKIKQLRLDGYSIKMLCKEFNVSNQIIERCLKDLGLTGDVRGFHKRYMELQQYKDEIVQKYLDGASILYLSKQYGFHFKLIRRLLESSGVELRKFTYVRYKKKDNIVNE